MIFLSSNYTKNFATPSHNKKSKNSKKNSKKSMMNSSSLSKKWKILLKNDKIRSKSKIKNLNKPSSQWPEILKLTWMKSSWKLWRKVKKILKTGISSNKRRLTTKRCTKTCLKWREKHLGLDCSKRQVSD